MKCALCSQNNAREPIVRLPNILKDLRDRASFVHVKAPAADNDYAHPSCVTTLLEKITKKESRLALQHKR